MSNVVEFPSNEHYLIADLSDEDSGSQLYLLDYVIGRNRTRIGDYPTIMALVAAMDKHQGITRPAGAA